MLPTKRNGAGNQQNYIPAGHDDGGEYTDGHNGEPVKGSRGEKVSSSQVEVSTPKHSGSFGRLLETENYTPKFKAHLESQFATGNQQSKDTIEYFIGEGKLKYFQTGGRDYYNGGNGINLSPTVGRRLQGEVFWHETHHGIDGRSMEFFSQAERYVPKKPTEASLVMNISTGVICPNGETMLQTLEGEFKKTRAEISATGTSLIKKEYDEDYQRRMNEKFPDHIELEQQGMNRKRELRKQALGMLGKDSEFFLSNDEIKQLNKNFEELSKNDPVMQRYEELSKYRRDLTYEMFKEWGGISDMYEAMGFVPFVGGHPNNYFKERKLKAQEFFAEYGSAFATGDTKTLSKFEMYFPETSKQCRYLINEVNRRSQK